MKSNNQSTVNKLEEQLRNSRETSMTGLYPPEGGWDAISTRLATGATAGGEVISGSTGSAVWKWLLGSCSLVALAALVYALALPTENKFSGPEIVPTESRSLATLNDTSTGKEETAVTKDLMVTGDVVAENAAPNKLNQEKSPAESKVAVKPATAGTAEITTTQRNQVNRQASTSAAELAGEGRQRTEETTTEDIRTPTSKAVEEETTNERLASGAENTIAPLPRKDQSVVESSKAKTPLFAVPALVQRTEMLTPEEPSFGELPEIVVPDFPTFKRNGKPRVRPEFQLHGSLSGHYVADARGSRFYTRNTSTGGAGRLFVLPSGEPVPVNFLRSDTESNIRRSVRLDVGISRQFGSGFLVRAATGVYHSTNGRRQSDFNLIELPEVREDFYERRFIVPLELGFQYTFRKRYRFRPYVGVNVVRYLHYDAVQLISFRDPQTQGVGVASLLRSQGVARNDMDYSLTTGFQYKVSDRLSVGLALYLHSQLSFFIENPFGIEVRHSLK